MTSDKLHTTDTCCYSVSGCLSIALLARDLYVLKFLALRCVQSLAMSYYPGVMPIYSHNAEGVLRVTDWGKPSRHMLVPVSRLGTWSWKIVEY